MVWVLLSESFCGLVETTEEKRMEVLRGAVGGMPVDVLLAGDTD